jgi:hypothetical protein
MEPIAMILGVRAVRARVASAGPNAPVVPYRHRSSRPALGPARRAAAGALRHLADRIEPRRAAAVA